MNAARTRRRTFTVPPAAMNLCLTTATPTTLSAAICIIRTAVTATITAASISPSRKSVQPLSSGAFRRNARPTQSAADISLEPIGHSPSTAVTLI